MFEDLSDISYKHKKLHSTCHIAPHTMYAEHSTQMADLLSEGFSLRVFFTFQLLFSNLAV